MLRLSVLRKLVETVRPDGTSAVADSAAAAWAIPPGRARHVRTSAAHVFSVPEHSAYLRLTPVEASPLARADKIAEAAAELAGWGAPVACPRAGRDGLVPVIDSPVGPLSACLVEAARGPSFEVDDLSPEQLRHWGRAIAEMHEAGAGISRAGLPRWTELITHAAAGLPNQTSLAFTAEGIADRLGEMLGPPDILGHGDPQPDNLTWTANGPLFFDLDDASSSWAIADLAMAIRDVQPVDQLDHPATSTAQGMLLLRGYREVRALEDAAERTVPTLQRGQALMTYGRLRASLDAAEADEPIWLAALRRKLESIASRLHIALANAPPVQLHPMRSIQPEGRIRERLISPDSRRTEGSGAGRCDREF
jgi:Ser/Thr protein kinase RdoA (MazF antagonist)